MGGVRERLLCILSLLFCVIDYRCHCKLVSGGKRGDMIVVLRWEEKLHLVQMQIQQNRQQRALSIKVWLEKVGCVQKKIKIVWAGEYRLMTQPRGQLYRQKKKKGFERESAWKYPERTNGSVRGLRDAIKYRG